MNVELHVTYQDATRVFKFPFSDFPMVTIRHLKQICGEAFGVEKGTLLRIFRAVSPDPSPESATASKQQFEELANNGTFHDYGVGRGALLVASDQPLAVPQKNLVADEMDRTIHVFHWVPPSGKTIMQMQADIREVFESFGSIYRVILSSLSPTQEEFTAIITFDSPGAARSAAAAMQSPAIVKALQEVTLLNKDIAVFTAVRDNPASEKEAEGEKSGAASVESSTEAKNTEEASESVAEAANTNGQAPSESRSSLDNAVTMAKSQLIHGYLDGRQGVALIAWTAEPVPLRALMGRAASAPVGQRVKAAAKIVGTRVQGAAKNALRWFKRTTTKEKMNAVKAKVAATARGVKADLKTAAKVVASTAVRAKDKVQAKLAKKSSSDTPGADGSDRIDDQHPEQDAVALRESSTSSTRSERQEYFLQQAAAQASGSDGSDIRENDNGGDAAHEDASGADDEDDNDIAHGAGDNDEDEDEDSERKPPPNLTFDDI